jgi:hypothetical protein
MQEKLGLNFMIASIENPGTKMKANKYRAAFIASIHKFAA